MSIPQCHQRKEWPIGTSFSLIAECGGDRLYDIGIDLIGNCTAVGSFEMVQLGDNRQHTLKNYAVPRLRAYFDCYWIKDHHRTGRAFVLLEFIMVGPAWL